VRVKCHLDRPVPPLKIRGRGDTLACMRRSRSITRNDEAMVSHQPFSATGFPNSEIAGRSPKPGVVMVLLPCRTRIQRL